MKGPVVPPVEFNWRDGKTRPLRKLRGDQPAHKRHVDTHTFGMPFTIRHRHDNLLGASLNPPRDVRQVCGAVARTEVRPERVGIVPRTDWWLSMPKSSTPSPRVSASPGSRRPRTRATGIPS